LNAIPYSSLNVICCGYETAGLGHKLDGFGFLVPKEEKRTVLGTLWDSSMFEQRDPAGRALLRSMAGGACRPELYELADDRLLQQVRDDLNIAMGIAKAPCFSRIVRHKRAIPQYLAGHGQRLTAIEEMANRHNGLFFTGNAFRGVGLNDCVASSLLTVERVLDKL
jgi:oxygen-dependent protoporphyrinogen oxidase